MRDAADDDDAEDVAVAAADNYDDDNDEDYEGDALLLEIVSHSCCPSCGSMGLRSFHGPH